VPSGGLRIALADSKCEARSLPYGPWEMKSDHSQ
jgi:hypothetical protein